MHQALFRLFTRLLARLGDVPRQQHAPVLAVDLGAVLGGRLLGEAPLRGQRQEALARHRAQRDDADAVLAGQSHARRADLRGDDELHVLLQRQELKGRVLQGVPLGLLGDALALEQAADDADRVVLAVALGHRVDAERVGVGRERARPRAEDGAAARHVVELHHALGHVVRMVIGQGDHAGAELDALGALAGGGQEHLGRGDHLPARRMMLTAPEFVVAQLIEMLDELEVAAELQGGIFADRMMGREECAEAHARHVGCSYSLING
jgi:hypothetical protein